jgi:4-hydroxy-tetrahydrodipicolinate reductase
MIKVILNGCSGRMGSVLTDAIAKETTLKVVGGIDVVPSKRDYPVFSSLQECDILADVLIDFSSFASLESYLPVAIKRNLPIVVATTGFGERELAMLKEAATSIAVFHSGNMSLGINLMQNLVKEVTKVLGSSFDIEIIEKHHNKKIDAPSGTALMLANSANDALEGRFHFIYGREGTKALRTKDEIAIHAVRGGTIVGEHEVIFAGEDEVISIKHSAFSRNVFAQGAIRAALFMAKQQKGFYTMSEVLKA